MARASSHLPDLPAGSEELSVRLGLLFLKTSVLVEALHAEAYAHR